MIQDFTIPGRLDGLNEYIDACRTNPRAGGRCKRENQDRVCWAIRQARLKPVSGCVGLSIHWIEPNARRDKDNVRSAVKYILDALVEMGIIKNDGWKDVGYIHDHYMVNRENPRVIVQLEEL